MDPNMADLADRGAGRTEFVSSEATARKRLARKT
jgi:hypothetical protein